MSNKFLNRSVNAARTFTGEHIGVGWDIGDDRLYVNPAGTKLTVPTINTGAASEGDVLTVNGAGRIVASAPTGGGAWGDITGTLADQTDLQSVLDAKASEDAAVSFASVSAGAAPCASTGDVRVPYEGAVVARNSDDSGDAALVTFGASGFVLGPNISSVPIVLDGQMVVQNGNNVVDLTGYDTHGFVMLGKGNSNTQSGSGAASAWAVIGDGNATQFVGGSVEDVYVFGGDNEVRTDTFIAVAVGEDNTLGAGADAASWMFAYGSGNDLQGTNATRLYAFGRDNQLDHSDTFAFGRSLATSGANQILFGSTNVADEVTVRSGLTLDLDPTTDLSINGTPGLTQEIVLTGLGTLSVTKGLITAWTPA